MTLWWAMVAAEWRKFLGRGLGLAGLVVAALHTLPAMGSLLIKQTLASKVAKLGLESGDACSLALQYSVLDMHNLGHAGTASLSAVMMPLSTLVLIAVTCEVFGGELQRGTLSTLMLRPIPRWKVLVAKLSALALYALALVALPTLLGLLIGLPLFGTSTAIPEECAVQMMLATDTQVATVLPHLALGMAAAWFTLLPIVGIATLFSVLSRSALLGTVASVALILLDTGIAWTTGAVGAMTVNGQGLDPSQVSWVKWFGWVHDATLYFNRQFWESWPEGFEEMGPPLLLLGIAAATMGLAALLLRRRDLA